MRRGTLTSTVVALLLLAVAAPAVAGRNECPDGWQAVWAPSRDGSGGRVAVVEGDEVEAWNYFDSESDGTLYANGVLLGVAPIANDARMTYPLDESPASISAVGRVSICVRGIELPDETTTTTVPVPDVTTTTVPVTTTTVPVPDVTTTTVPVPDVTTTTVPVPDVTTTTVVTIVTVNEPPNDVVKCVPTADGEYVVNTGPDKGKSCLPITGSWADVLTTIGSIGLVLGLVLLYATRRRKDASTSAASG